MQWWNSSLASIVLVGPALALSTWATVCASQICRQGISVQEIWGRGGYVKYQHQLPQPIGNVSKQLAELLPAWPEPVILVRLAETEINDAHLKSIGRLVHQQLLDLRDTQIGDAGLDHLDRLTELRFLFLTGTKVSDSGLGSLRPMQQLEVLCLEETGIGDAGLRELKRLPNLCWLNVSGSRITDAGLAQLAKCPALKVLIAEGCDISDAGVAQLTKAIPDLKVFRGETRRPSLGFLATLNGS